MLQPLDPVAQALHRLEACRDNLDGGFERPPIDGGAADIAVDAGDAAQLLEMPRADDRAALDHAQGLGRDGADPANHRCDMQGGLVDADLRRHPGDAALVPAEIDVDDI